MEIIQKYMTNNDCYNIDKKIAVSGIMVHSTATPGVMALDWFDRWNKSYDKGEIDRQACVHAFVDNSIVMQCLPWNHRGWHAGGKANDTHVSFEICEPKDLNNKEYFDIIWNKSIELCVMLCKQFNLTPKAIICHSEGYKKGIASNHADVMHWFPLQGRDMDMFRQEVKIMLEKKQMTLDEAKKIVQTSCQLSDSTMQFLDCYKYSDALFIKLATAIKQI